MNVLLHLGKKLNKHVNWDKKALGPIHTNWKWDQMRKRSKYEQKDQRINEKHQRKFSLLLLHLFDVNKPLCFEHKCQILGSESFNRWLVWGTSTLEPGKIGKFLHPHCLWVHKVPFFHHLVVIECPHHLTLSAPLKLHSFLSKMTIHRSLPPPKILRQEAKSNY